MKEAAFITTSFSHYFLFMEATVSTFLDFIVLMFVIVMQDDAF